MPNVNIDTSTDGTTLVAGTAGTFIRVLGYALSSASAVGVTLKSNTTVIASTNATQATGGGEVCPPHDDWQLDCAAGEDLKIGLSGAVNVKGHLSYVKKPAGAS